MLLRGGRGAVMPLRQMWAIACLFGNPSSHSGNAATSDCFARVSCGTCGHEEPDMCARTVLCDAADRSIHKGHRLPIAVSLVCVV